MAFEKLRNLLLDMPYREAFFLVALQNLQKALVHVLLIREALLDLRDVRVGVVEFGRRRLLVHRASRCLLRVAHLDLVARRQEGVEPQDEPLAIAHAASDMHPALGTGCALRPLPTLTPRTACECVRARSACVWSEHEQEDLVASEEFGHALNH